MLTFCPPNFVDLNYSPHLAHLSTINEDLLISRAYDSTADTFRIVWKSRMRSWIVLAIILCAQLAPCLSLLGLGRQFRTSLSFYGKKQCFLQRSPSRLSASEGKGDKKNATKKNINKEKVDPKIEAMNLLDIITCPRDENDPDYDVEKDVKRDEILRDTDYNALKVELRSRNLRTSGDKLEMMSRLLLHIIDPSINFNKLSGREPNLKYVSPEDLADTTKLRMIPEESKRKVSNIMSDPDAEDLKIVKNGDYGDSGSLSNSILGDAGEDDVQDDEREFDPELSWKESQSKPKPPRLISEKKKPNVVIMDGLTRRELEFPPLHIQRSQEVSRLQDKKQTIRAYVVGGRDVLKTWERVPTVVVVLSDESGWRSKATRVFADEIAFANQAIVIVPDIFRGNPWSSMKNEDDEAIIDPPLDGNNNAIKGGGTRKSSMESLASTYQAEDVTSSDPAYMYTQEYKDWVKKLPYKRIFDDVVATLQFARLEYNCNSTSLAGVGLGAGKALEIASDMTDLANLGRVRRGIVGDRFKFFNLDSLDDQSKGNGEGGNINNEDEDEDESEDDDDEEGERDSVEKMMENLSSSLAEMSAAAEAEEQARAANPDAEDESTPSSSSPFDFDAMEAAEREEERRQAQQRELEMTKLKDEIAKQRKMFQSAELDRQRASALLAQEKNLLAEYATLTPEELIELEPRAVFGVSPSNYDMNRVAASLFCPTFLVFGHKDINPGANEEDSIHLHKALKARAQRPHGMCDFSFRTYEGRGSRFAHHPLSVNDVKCSQETIAFGSVWLDIYSRNWRTDATLGMGEMSSAADAHFAYVPMEAMISEVRSSAVGSYLHDDPDNFCNQRFNDK